MNKSIGIVIVIVIVLVLGYLFLGANDNDNSDGASGEVFISFTDETVQIENINEISMEVDEVSLYSETQGWIKVSTDDIEYRLLELKARGENRLYATVDAAADTYTRVRVKVKEVVVEETNNAKENARMPKAEFDLVSKVEVRENQQTSLNLDVLADQSLHITTSGEYVFAPVIKVESRSNADVQADSSGVVTISGGSVDSNSTFGMDINGSVSTGFKLDSNVQLNIGSGGTIQVVDSTGSVIEGAGVINIESNASSNTNVDGVLDSSLEGTAEGSAEGNLKGALDL